MSTDDLLLRIANLELKLTSLENKYGNNAEPIQYLINYFDSAKLHKLTFIMDKLDSFLFNPNDLQTEILNLSSRIDANSHRFNEHNQKLNTVIELLLEIIISDYPELVLKHIDKIDSCKKTIGANI